LKALGKALFIAVFFMGSMYGLIEIKGEVLSRKKLHKMVFIESTGDWQKCKMDGARIDDKFNSVILFSSGITAELTTEIITPGFAYDQLILSWNAEHPDSTGALLFSVEVSEDSTNWHKFAYQIWGERDDIKADGKKAIEGIGRMATDYLVLQKPMRYARVMVKFAGVAGGKDVKLRRLSLSFAGNNSTWQDYKTFHPEMQIPVYTKTKLAVPYFSQRNLPIEISGSCCSPTSVSMVLYFHGKDISAESFAYQAYDKRGEIYGNWPHNAAAAYDCGMSKTWIDSHCSFDEIYNEVSSGKPVVISIAYGFDELPRSPIHEAPEGHLIVVVGFDGPNTVICNDPAGHGVDDGIVPYPRQELEKIWVGHGGIAYHIWPE
jgi:uncharacterized protein YvpB